MIISLIVAASENNAIGKDNTWPWNLPSELAYFTKTTSGHAVIMGRKTHESIGRVLENRTNIVLSRQKDYSSKGVIVKNSLIDALDFAREIVKEKEVFVIGGGDVYQETLPFADKIYMTRVHATLDGDVFIPFMGDGWEKVSENRVSADAENEYDYSIQVYAKKRDSRKSI